MTVADYHSKAYGFVQFEVTPDVVSQVVDTMIDARRRDRAMRRQKQLLLFLLGGVVLVAAGLLMLPPFSWPDRLPALFSSMIEIALAILMIIEGVFAFRVLTRPPPEEPIKPQKYLTLK
jgi:hypothetical protein